MGKQANIIPPLQIIRNYPLEQLPINYICRFSIIATNFFFRKSVSRFPTTVNTIVPTQ